MHVHSKIHCNRHTIQRFYSTICARSHTIFVNSARASFKSCDLYVPYTLIKFRLVLKLNNFLFYLNTQTISISFNLFGCCGNLSQKSLAAINNVSFWNYYYFWIASILTPRAGTNWFVRQKVLMSKTKTLLSRQ